MDDVIITCHRLDAYESVYTVLAELRPELAHQERVRVADAIVRRLSADAQRRCRDEVTVDA